jgi:hypothetical protein
LSTLDTVPTETPAALATSLTPTLVVRRLRAPSRVLTPSPRPP